MVATGVVGGACVDVEVDVEQPSMSVSMGGDTPPPPPPATPALIRLSKPVSKLELDFSPGDFLATVSSKERDRW